MLNSGQDLFQTLNAYSRSDYYPFHMPGHKRQAYLSPSVSPEQIDITEISGFDDLHHPTGILKDAQERMAEVFGSWKSFFLVNGSTAGILAAICACTPKNGRILMARNCHKSVYHAALLQELSVDYLEPPVTAHGLAGSIIPDTLTQTLRNTPSPYQAVVITSPTYDGIVSDIRTLADIVHAHRIPLIVDAAHGAHFGFSDGFPKRALTLGADVVIESLHKTLPALTQSAVLHLSDSPYVSEEKIRQYLSIFQTSSPSYILMAGMDQCTKLLQAKQDELFSDFGKKLTAFYEEAVSLKNISVLYAKNHLRDLQNKTCGTLTDTDPFVFQKDPSKILISADAIGLSGAELSACLRDAYHLELEMISLHYATALSTVMDTQEGFDRLINALKELDQNPPTKKKTVADSFSEGNISCVADNKKSAPEEQLEIWQAMEQPGETVPLSDCVGRLCRDFIIPYPPGIPLIVPGEIITKEHIRQIQDYMSQNIPVYGITE